MNKNDGMNYAPEGKGEKVVDSGEFAVAAVGLDHGHIYGMCNGLQEAGADIVAVYDPDDDKVASFQEQFPKAEALTEDEIFNNPEIDLIASAAVPKDRPSVGLKALDHGKHYFSDKPAFTTHQQIDAAKEKVQETGLKWGIYYSERLHVESAVFAGQLIDQGAIGRVIQVTGMGPHRARIEQRPEWFFDPEYYGGILCDIGSHQIEQFLHYADADDAEVVHSKVANYDFKEYPKFQDFGDASLVADNGATFHFRVDWFTPDGLGSWGDGRVFIIGTEGYIEVRKYIDVARDETGDQVYLVTQEGEKHFSVNGQVGCPFFGQFILDCLNNTENAMTQRHAFKVASLAVEAQKQAEFIER